MLLDGGTYEGRPILSQASLTAMTVDQIRNAEITLYGLGWQISRQAGAWGGPLASSRAYGHGGSTGVYVWVDPENDLAGAFLIHGGSELSLVRNTFMTMAAAAVVGR